MLMMSPFTLSFKKSSNRYLRDSIESLRKKMLQLKALSQDVMNKIDISRNRGMKAKLEVEEWLNKVSSVEQQLDKLYGRAELFGGCGMMTSFTTRSKLMEKIKKTESAVVDLIEAGKFEVVAVESLPSRYHEMPGINRDTILGLDPIFDVIWTSLKKDDKCGIIGICGLGGVGKTTLLMKVNNEIGIFNVFDFVIWVSASENSTVGEIQDNILRRLHLTDNYIEAMSVHEKASIIYRTLSKKRFVLLMDDIWERIDVAAAGIPTPDSQNKSKIVFTTRSMDICSRMGAQRLVKLSGLAPRESWKLFCTKVGEKTLNSHTRIPFLADTVARECGGFPLALVSLGLAMANKTTPEEWEYAIAMFKQTSEHFSAVFHYMKVSFMMLRTDVAKECFLDCCLFPAEYPISKTKLVDYWIGEGYFIGLNDKGASRNVGLNIVGEMVSACLLQDDGYSVKINKLVREMGLWIAPQHGKKNKDNFFVRVGFQLIEAPAVKWQEVEKLSLMDNRINSLAKIPPCPKLSTLILSRNSLRSIHDDIFTGMSVLKVLDLSWCLIEGLPSSIGELVSLQYLNLSHTKISGLPQWIDKLINLKVLDLSYIAELAPIPSGVISKLSSLQVLDMYHCGHADWEKDEDDTFVGASKEFLEELESQSLLDDLGLSIKGACALSNFQTSRTLQVCTRSLSIVQCQGLTSLPLSWIQSMRHLHTLEICYCSELEKFKVQRMVGEGSSQNSATSFVYFYNLQHVTIEKCWSLKELTWLSFAPNLQSLKIDSCMNLKEVVPDRFGGESAGGKTPQPFQRLKTLYLSHLPELEAIRGAILPFPFLKEINIMYCPKLRKLPLDFNSGENSNIVIKGQKIWWEQLQWDDESNKSAFTPYFISIE